MLEEYFGDNFDCEYQLPHNRRPIVNNFEKFFNYKSQVISSTDMLEFPRNPLSKADPSKTPGIHTLRRKYTPNQIRQPSYHKSNIQINRESSMKIKLHRLQVAVDMPAVSEGDTGNIIYRDTASGRHLMADDRRPCSRDMSSLDSPKMNDGQAYFTVFKDLSQVNEDEDEIIGGEGSYDVKKNINERKKLKGIIVHKKSNVHTQMNISKLNHDLENKGEISQYNGGEDEEGNSEYTNTEYFSGEEENINVYEQPSVDYTATAEHSEAQLITNTASGVISTPLVLDKKSNLNSKVQGQRQAESPPRTIIHVPIKRPHNGMVRNVFEDKEWKKKVQETKRKIKEDQKTLIIQNPKVLSPPKKKHIPSLQLETGALNLQPLNTIDDVNFYKYHVDKLPDSKNPIIIMNFTAAPSRDTNATVTMTRHVVATNPGGITPRTTTRSIDTSADSDRLERDRRRFDETDDHFRKLEIEGRQVQLRFTDPEMAGFMNRVMVSRARNRDRRGIAPEIAQEALQGHLRNQALNAVLESYENLHNKKGRRGSSMEPKVETRAQKVRKQLKVYKAGQDIPPELLRQLEEEVMALQKNREKQSNFPLPLPENEEDMNLDENEREQLDKSILMGVQSEKNKKHIDVNPNLREPTELSVKKTTDILLYYDNIKQETYLDNNTIHSEVLDLGEGGYYKKGWDNFEREELKNDSTISNHAPPRSMLSSSVRSPEKLYKSVREAANSRNIGNMIFIKKEDDPDTPLIPLAELHKSKTDESMLPLVRRNIYARSKDLTASDYSADYDEDGVRIDPKLKAKINRHGNLFDEPKKADKDLMSAQELLKRKREQEEHLHRMYNTKPESDIDRYQRNLNGKNTTYEILAHKGILLDRSETAKIDRGRKGFINTASLPLAINSVQKGPKKKAKVTFAVDTKEQQPPKIISRMIT